MQPDHKRRSSHRGRSPNYHNYRILNLFSSCIQRKDAASKCNAASYHAGNQKTWNWLRISRGSASERKLAIPFPNVFLSFTSSGTWVYALTSQVQQHIKALVTGKRKTIALHFLSSLPGIERVS